MDVVISMPIQLHRVVHQRALYEQSIQSRYNDRDDNDNNKECSSNHTIASIDVAIKIHESVRHWRKQYNQKLIDKTIKEVAATELENAIAELEVVLEKLPNWIDHEIFQAKETEIPVTNRQHEHDLDRNYDTNKTGNGERPLGLSIPHDPVFCIGGYERMPFNNVILTGPACRMTSLLTQYFLESLEHTPSLYWIDHNGKQSVQRFDLPACIPVVASTGTEHANDLSRTIPSWQYLLQSQHGTVLWDRQLPCVHLLHCHGIDQQDIRHPFHKKHYSHTARKGHRTTTTTMPWYQQYMSSTLSGCSQQIQFLILAGPSLECDSRPLQQQLMKHIRSMYQQLLPTDEDNTYANNHCSLQIRAIPSHQLTFMESSRLVLEASWSQASPSGRNKCSRRHPQSMELAHLSNIQDYYCNNNNDNAKSNRKGHNKNQTFNGCCIRHGTTHEGLHVVHGTILHSAMALEWLCQVRATTHGVAIPNILLQGQEQQHNPESLGLDTTVYNYIRQIVSKKGGKQVVQDLHLSQSKSITTTVDLSRPLITKATNGIFANLNPSVAPTPERIQSEALSLPFPSSLLPFYNNNNKQSTNHQ